MAPRFVVELLALAALWGASFLFMRLSAPEFGPWALSFVRVALASLSLLPLLLWRGQFSALRQHWRAIAVVGVVNSALPFLAYSLAALSITAGLASIFNATAPLWAALIAWLWLHQRPAPARIAGLAIGFFGVAALVWNKASFGAGAAQPATTLAILATLGATFCYGWSANFTQRYLKGVPPLAVATGSQISAALALALPAWWAWPAQPPSVNAWWAATALGLACTGLAYLLYFRLIAHVGSARAIAVTFLIPLFAVLWGGLFLAEAVTVAMVLGGAVILLGTALATGLWAPKWRLSG